MMLMAAFVVAALAQALPEDCARANSAIRKSGSEILREGRLPTASDISGKWAEFAAARHACPYGLWLPIDDDEVPDLAFIIPSKKSGFLIGVVLSSSRKAHVVHRGPEAPQQKGVVHTKLEQGVFYVDYGELVESFRWSDEDQAVVRIYRPPVRM